MRIKRRFRFYAAHRNAELNDKCSRLHGHRYGIEVTLEVKPTGKGVGILFAEIDRWLSPIFEELDHRTLAHENDPVARAIPDAVILPFATSAEHMAAYLLARCRGKLPEVVELALTETDSATVVATIEDIAIWLGNIE